MNRFNADPAAKQKKKQKSADKPKKNDTVNESTD